MVGAAAAASLLAACQPMVNRRGYYAKPGALNQVREGLAKLEVEAIMGSPSTTASVNLQGDSYYYISSVTTQRSFLDPQEQTREIIAIRFDRNDQVTSVAQYGLEDGRIINMLDRKTLLWARSSASSTNCSAARARLSAASSATRSDQPCDPSGLTALFP